MKRVLHLTLKRDYFAKIAKGTKRIEFRERKLYWKTRLENRSYDMIRFRNGYATNAPEMLVQFRGLGKARGHYEILLRRVISIKRWPTRPQ